MKKFGFRCICLLLLVSCLVFPAKAVEEEQDISLSISAGCHSIDAKLSLIGSGRIIENATSVVLFETKSETLMYDWYIDEKTDPASLVKIMTALLAFENGGMEDMVLVSAEALSSVSATAVSADLQEGEILTLKDLIYCMMVGSANDAAAVIAEHIGGSQAGFVTMMNQRATELGCTATNFINAHGLYHNNQYTTARDMVRILSAALKNEGFTEVFGTARYTVPKTNMTEERKLVTNNFLISQDVMEIYYDTRVVGGRAGAAEDGTRCIAAVSESNGLQFISIVFGTKSVFEENTGAIVSYGGFNETIALLDKGFDGYRVCQILNENQVLQQRPVLNGANDVILGTKTSASAVLPANITSADLEFRYQFSNEAFQAPVKKDVPVAELQVWYKGLCVAFADVYTMNAVGIYTPLPPDPVLEATGSVWPIILVIILLIVALFVAHKLMQRRARIKRREKRQQQAIRGRYPDRRRR